MLECCHKLQLQLPQSLPSCMDLSPMQSARLAGMQAWLHPAAYPYVSTSCLVSWTRQVVLTACWRRLMSVLARQTDWQQAQLQTDCAAAPEQSQQWRPGWCVGRRWLHTGRATDAPEALPGPARASGSLHTQHSLVSTPVPKVLQALEFCWACMSFRCWLHGQGALAGCSCSLSRREWSIRGTVGITLSSLGPDPLFWVLPGAYFAAFPADRSSVDHS